MNSSQKSNPLGSAPLNKLIVKFAIPSIIAMLVTSLYNIVDQIFIGNYVGELGNAATNIAYPLSTLCAAISLLLGIGGAAAFNLHMGAGQTKRAGMYVGNSVLFAALSGVLIFVIAELFLEPMLLFFGSSASILPYAKEYTRITAVGFPFFILSIAGGHLIRADGKPMVSMICNLTGAVINTVLDALFVVGFGWGMTGAAAATVIGQAAAAMIVLYHIGHYRTVKLTPADFVPKAEIIGTNANLGMSQGFNQVAMMVVQIVSNNSLKYYGAQSAYGVEIPIAIVGIVTKLTALYFSFCIGLSHAMQPIASFNYGAKNYRRTQEAFRKTRNAGTVVSILAFLLFQLFPRPIISIFGAGSELYYEFAVKYMRIYLFCVFLNNIQPLTSTFLSAIGKPKKGLFLSLTRQIIFLLPLILILPLFFGIDGMMYAGAIADFMAAA
ncbi:MAG: MATE family efflux transporter, partial [Lachnospiraceae bacterium]|nr:MATE family efflux transporter [Lachnospiraceae bacterium]